MFLLTMATLTLYVAHVTSRSLEQPSTNDDVMGLISSLTANKRSMEPTNICNEFTPYPNTISLAGAQLRPIGDGYTNEHCMESCLLERTFTCAAILIQQPSSCYLTGYNLRNDFFSQHYTRVCSNGPQCFTRTPYKSADFKHRIDIPAGYRESKIESERFCIETCEQRESCVGFDFVHQADGRPKCMFQEVQTVPDNNFDLYIRRC